MKISWKNMENWRSWKMRFFWGGRFEFLSRPLWFFFCFISVKKPAGLNEVSFFSALWMVFPESWKRSCSNFYAHDCNHIFWVRKKRKWIVIMKAIWGSQGQRWPHGEGSRFWLSNKILVLHLFKWSTLLHCDRAIFLL